MERSLLSGVAAFRWVAPVWMALVVVLLRHDLARLWVAQLLTGLAAAVTATLTVLLRSDRPALLRLEMLLPNEAWQEWSRRPVAEGTGVAQTARFRPRGLVGCAYWCAVLPCHPIIFPGHPDGIARDAEQGRTVAGEGSKSVGPLVEGLQEAWESRSEDTVHD